MYIFLNIKSILIFTIDLVCNFLLFYFFLCCIFVYRAVFSHICGIYATQWNLFLSFLRFYMFLCSIFSIFWLKLYGRDRRCCPAVT